MESSKTVLVCIGERKRPVHFSASDIDETSALMLAIREVFQDIIAEDTEIVLQMKDEEWAGEFVDIQSGNATIPDKSVVRVVMQRPPVCDTSKVRFSIENIMVWVLKFMHVFC